MECIFCGANAELYKDSVHCNICGARGPKVLSVPPGSSYASVAYGLYEKASIRIRNAALEEAAKMCDQIHQNKWHEAEELKKTEYGQTFAFGESDGAKQAAEEIRKLKGEEKQDE